MSKYERDSSLYLIRVFDRRFAGPGGYSVHSPINAKLFTRQETLQYLQTNPGFIVHVSEVHYCDKEIATRIEQLTKLQQLRKETTDVYNSLPHYNCQIKPRRTK